jgi:DNA replication protein DnaC
LARKNCTVGFINTSELVSYLKSNFGTDRISTIINTLKSVEYLFIDDIGAENISD